MCGPPVPRRPPAVHLDPAAHQDPHPPAHPRRAPPRDPVRAAPRDAQAPPAVNTPRAPTGRTAQPGTVWRSVSPPETGPSTPATGTTADCSSQPPHGAGSAEADCPTRRPSRSRSIAPTSCGSARAGERGRPARSAWGSAETPAGGATPTSTPTAARRPVPPSPQPGNGEPDSPCRCVRSPARVPTGWPRSPAGKCCAQANVADRGSRLSTTARSAGSTRPTC